MADTTDEISTAGLEEGVNVFFLLVCTVLILMMQAGFALYEVGTIARTPVEVILIKNIMDASIAYASWFALGSTFAGDGNRFIGSGDAGPFFTGDEYNGDDTPLAYMRFLFFAMFAGTAVTVMSGSVADRVPYLLYAICVLDFAGSGVVHLFAGTASFVWAKLLPARTGRFVLEPDSDRVNFVNYGEGFNLQDRTHQALGVFLLWLGWYGFNCGSALSITSSNSIQIVSITAVNTTLAPVVCCLTSIFIEWAYFENWLHIRNHFVMGQAGAEGDDCENRDYHSAAINGILSGLVSITAGCATTDPRLTIVIAVVAAFVYHYSYRMQLHRGLDDAVNAVPVHFYCGLWGLFSAALMFAPGRHAILMSAYGVDESRGTCGRGDQVAANMAFAAAVVVWSAATSVILYFTLNMFFKGYLEPIDGGPQPELSRLAHIMEGVELIIKDTRATDAVRNRAPVSNTPPAQSTETQRGEGSGVAESAMDVSSFTLPATWCFLAVKLTFQTTRQATPKRPKRGKSKGGADQAQQGAGTTRVAHLPTEVAFKSLILAALKDLHGEVGSLAYPVDILSWDAVNGEGCLRVPARSLVPVRAALSLVGSCGNVPCAIDVTDTSPFLAGLACDRYL
eukprot:g5073.t1